jgi:hypothetical protein
MDGVWAVDGKIAAGMEINMKLNEVKTILKEAGDLVTTLKPGDTVWVRWNNHTTKTGVIKRIGRTMIHVTLKNGETVAFPPKDVTQDFEDLNPNPYREERSPLDEVSQMKFTDLYDFQQRAKRLGYTIKKEGRVLRAYNAAGHAVGEFIDNLIHGGQGHLVLEAEGTNFTDFLVEANVIKKLKDNKKPLTPEEREEVVKAGATWSDGTPGIHKSVDKNGKATYYCYTHRAYQAKPTLKGAIKAFDFIKTTA